MHQTLHVVSDIQWGSMPELSIIIPCFNEQKGIALFIHKLQKLRPQCEVILVDGGSDDKTVQIAEPFVDLLIHSPCGRAQQMNAGAEKACSNVLIFLHADTFLPDDAVSQIQQALQEGYRWGRFDIRLTGGHWFLPVISYFMNIRSAISGIITGDQALFIDKSLFKEVGCYPNIAIMEDIALAKNLKKYGKPFRVYSCVHSSARRWLQYGVYKTILLMWCLRLEYFLGIDPKQLSQQYQGGQFWKS
jgi:rSAM/selenodomain-associated transferase 2